MPIEFKNNNAVRVEENTLGVFLNLEASRNNKEADLDVTYSILSGNDQSLFTLDSATGELRFSADAAPAYSSIESNVYSLTVAASRGVAETETQIITLTVTDQYTDNPVSGYLASYELAGLNGIGGFKINGIDAHDHSGKSVSGAGDVNGDGIDDLIIGAPLADPNDNGSGESYVIFGSSTGFAASLDLTDLDGTNGFALNGVNAGDNSGISVSSAGDVNGDGIGDIIIGAYRADPNNQNNAGESYVVFGKDTDTEGNFAAIVDLSSLDGSNGFVLNGNVDNDASGWSVSSAGDVNGDGYSDLIIGASYASPNGSSSGASYVVFGAGTLEASIDLAALDGSDGFILNGVDAYDYSGLSVSGAGDVNGDGYGDLIIGAYGANPNGENSGETYVVFGSEGGFSASVELAGLDGSNGFKINGVEQGDYSGYSVSGAGDVNGDGYDDLIISAPEADPNNTNKAGESYVVFGAVSGFAATLELSTLDGSNGFVLQGIDAWDKSGYTAASSAGDVNGDGYDDLIIGAYNANGGAGETYVVFGADDFTTTPAINLSSLDGNTGFKLNGIDRGDYSGWAASGAGDINGDGYDDIIIGARLADSNGSNAGETYVVFGGEALQLGLITPTDFDDSLEFGLAGDDISAGNGNDYVAGNEGNDTIDGGAGHDTISGGGGDDVIYGGGGSDSVNGDEGNDVIYSGGGDDTINGGTGDDTLGGRSGDDVIYGDAGSDVFFNGTGADTVFGGDGDDILWGGEDDDQLTGDSGADTFSFTLSSGNDQITDFDLGEDILDLSSTGFADINALISVAEDTSNGLLVTLGAGATIVLTGLTVSDLGDMNITYSV